MSWKKKLILKILKRYVGKVELNLQVLVILRREKSLIKLCKAIHSTLMELVITSQRVEVGNGVMRIGLMVPIKLMWKTWVLHILITQNYAPELNFTWMKLNHLIAIQLRITTCARRKVYIYILYFYTYVSHIFTKINKTIIPCKGLSKNCDQRGDRVDNFVRGHSQRTSRWPRRKEGSAKSGRSIVIEEGGGLEILVLTRRPLWMAPTYRYVYFDGEE